MRLARQPFSWESPGLVLALDQEPQLPTLFLLQVEHGVLQAELFHNVFMGSALQGSLPHLQRKYKKFKLCRLDSNLSQIFHLL